MQQEAKNILVCLAGTTPAVVTETLWALEQKGLRVDEIRVVTTTIGHAALTKSLFDPPSQLFVSYLRDYPRDPGQIYFHREKSFHILRGQDGNELEDIRDERDNLAAADHMFQLVRTWTRREEETLICSLAGGRKTMGFFLATCLMLFGRPQDRLFHVLINPRFEGLPGFGYPPARPTEYVLPNGERLTSDQSGVVLAEVPLIRLGQFLGPELREQPSYADAVGMVDSILEAMTQEPEMVLDLFAGRVSLGEFTMEMPRQLMAVYLFLLAREGDRLSLEQALGLRNDIVTWERHIDRLTLPEPRLMARTYRLAESRDLEEFAQAFRPVVSKINGVLRHVMGPVLARRFEVRIQGGQYWLEPFPWRVDPEVRPQIN